MSEDASVVVDLARIYTAAAASDDGQRCMCAPAPELQERLVHALHAARDRIGHDVPLGRLKADLPRPPTPGFNDGLIIPGTHFRLGTPPATVRRAAAERAPLRGTVRIVVVLVDFSDQEMLADPAHFEQLFFSQNQLATGSVRDYFHEVTHGLIDLQGEVVGPYRLPQTMAHYANGQSGGSTIQPNMRTMAHDTAVLSDPDVNFALYDNDNNGFVDAFIVVHAGPGAEVTGSPGDLWSSKWVLPSAFPADGASIFAFLTIPEDARIGVTAHEIGHLVFGWPDLYDTDESSNGIGNWCLMGSGNWNGGGDTPAHPSAWCKAGQGWVSVVNHAADATVPFEDVKDSHLVHRLWRNGEPSTEYFLVENRQRTRFDAQLPGDGLLIWHIDDSVGDNTDETHYQVALEQADGLLHLENLINRGDGGDSYPGTANNRDFSGTSTPSSNSYAGTPTSVAVTDLSNSATTMTARIQVTGSVAPPFPGRLLRQPPLMQGADVLQWQTQMVVRGHAITADGIYGPMSEQACRALQAHAGLVVDGIVGPNTWQATWTAAMQPTAELGEDERVPSPREEAEATDLQGTT